uniref:JD1 n=1 Tax=Solanum tuberosum TaxID=4113 RepID=M0ZFZ6_SOLTU
MVPMPINLVHFSSYGQICCNTHGEKRAINNGYLLKQPMKSSLLIFPSRSISNKVKSPRICNGQDKRSLNKMYCNKKNHTFNNLST